MVFGIGLGMTVLSNTENGFFIQNRRKIKVIIMKKERPKTAGIVSSGV